MFCFFLPILFTFSKNTWNWQVLRTFVAKSKMSRFTRFIRKVFAWKILLPGKFSLFLTLALGNIKIFNCFLSCNVSGIFDIKVNCFCCLCIFKYFKVKSVVFLSLCLQIFLKIRINLKIFLKVACSSAVGFGVFAGLGEVKSVQNIDQAKHPLHRPPFVWFGFQPIKECSLTELERGNWDLNSSLISNR